MIIKLIYTVFLALLVALFVGLGIDAFYPAPEAPDYPARLEAPLKSDCSNCTETAEDKAAREEYNQAQDKYQEDSKVYNRNVSIIALAAAIIILIFSLTLLSKIKMIADGILLGGVFTTAYGIIRGLMSDSSRFRFFIVAVGLVIAFVLGYIKFIRPKKTLAKR
ncbi:hypothetical protein KKD72_01375 [Patescibacteria group bacterium]|nr:hypothetical protein [Patescibacteria group bacterium]